MSHTYGKREVLGGGQGFPSTAAPAKFVGQGIEVSAAPPEVSLNDLELPCT